MLLLSINTKSGRNAEVLMLLGSVAGGLSDALHDGMSAYIWQDDGIKGCIIFTSLFKTESCLQVKRPCVRAV